MTRTALYSGNDRVVDYMTPSFYSRAVSPFSEDISAAKYLRYAELDYRDGSERGLINALGNAKRALHLVVDYTLHAYGLLRSVKRSSFPKKLQMLDSAGLLPISILRQLNLERNVMEHEYGTPPRQRVAEAIDVTKILLLATRKIWEEALYECAVGLTGPPKQHAMMRLHPDLGVIKFYRLTVEDRHLRDHDGVKYVNHVRSLRSVNSGIEVEDAAFREIAIQPSNVDEWSPWIKMLVSFAVGLVDEMDDVHTVPQGGTIRFGITVPLGVDNIDKIEAIISAMDSGDETEDLGEN